MSEQDDTAAENEGELSALVDVSAEDLRWLMEPPPEGAPWDLPLDEAPLVLLDCEMTGTDPSRDALIEVALRRVRGGQVEGALTTLLRADVPSSEGALAAHGIDDAMLHDAPTFAEVAPALTALLEGAVMVAHGASLDRAFLNGAFASIGAPTRVTHMLDTVLLARRAVLAPSYRLAAVAAALGLPPRRWHRAEEDVAALGDILARLVEVLRPASPRDLWQVRAGVRLPSIVRDTITRRLDRGRDGKPFAVIVRQPGRVPRRMVGRVMRWESPHLTLGLGASGRIRGVSILRADRILRIDELP